jgi:NTE family protein
MSSRSDRVAFVLSQGASPGAVQVGMLHALYERGIAPQLIVGTSVGAVNGAFMASRPQTSAWRRCRLSFTLSRSMC